MNEKLHNSICKLLLGNLIAMMFIMFFSIWMFRSIIDEHKQEIINTFKESVKEIRK